MSGQEGDASRKFSEFSSFKGSFSSSLAATGNKGTMYGPTKRSNLSLIFVSNILYPLKNSFSL